MISSISVSGFKCFKELTNLPLRPLSVLVGGNAAGKSTLIQTLLLLRQSANRDGLVQELQLSGELYSGGTAADVVRLDADRKLSTALSEDGKGTVALEAGYESGTNPRKLKLVRPSNVGVALHYSSTEHHFVYLAAERIGPRVTYPITVEGSLAGPIGMHGEQAATFMARCKKDDLRPHEGWLRVFDVIQKAIAPEVNFGSPPELTTYPLAGAFESWITPGVRFDAIEDPEADLSRVTFNNYSRDPRATVRPTNIGFGLTQVLPVIAGLVAVTRGGLYVLENPEAHLHPLGQSRVGSAIALAVSTGIQVIAETHSDHVVNGIRLAVKRGWLNSRDVAFYYFQKREDDNKATVQILPVDDGGRLPEWPPGFFDQIEKDLAQL